MAERVNAVRRTSRWFESFVVGCMVVVSLEEKKGSSTDRGTEAHMCCPWQEKVLALATESFWGRRWVLCKANAPVMISWPV
jgi:hypothetical protein